jgi:hypothetical protein
MQICLVVNDVTLPKGGSSISASIPYDELTTMDKLGH